MEYRCNNSKSKRLHCPWDEAVDVARGLLGQFVSIKKSREGILPGSVDIEAEGLGTCKLNGELECSSEPAVLALEEWTSGDSTARRDDPQGFVGGGVAREVPSESPWDGNNVFRRGVKCLSKELST